ncbi:ABC transporter ATP-binding protein [Paenibacillus chondroitinus]|uniref:ABC transporter ATP-binding protein n=1 Tax=Paenibacillus chondroitinus TaxID=59842 RepID=A0ABU6DBR5_9BACL|nr:MULTISPECIES: ABC transporter ATP-binding protein [Paenibacillus]MCY9660206.1 ABC transporter ATP-binding protein [Paenibacillus anseongense]MEB4795191.1 ABC transporter ATP-binding protein [Paenibacillus chondroitinus]
MGAQLSVDRLGVEFAVNSNVMQAISDISFSIQPGEIVCLVGESGSGKSVTSKAIMRLIEHENGTITSGTITLGDVDVTTLSQQKLRSLRGKRIAMVFQEPMAAFDPVFTIGSQIIETIRRHDRHITVREAEDEAVRLLQRVGIPEPKLRLKQYPGELSGGMLQRAMIAMALSGKPELLIADEPTTALDVTIQAQILQLLQELRSEFNMSILLITHDLGVAAEMADRIIVMYAGQIVEQSTAVDLFTQPRHPYTLGLLRSITTLDSDRAQPLYAIPGSIPGMNNLPTGCRFHPRCAYATELCAREAPALEDRGGRQSACWHADLLPELQDARVPEQVTELDVRERATRNEMSSKQDVVPKDVPLIELRHVTKHYPVKSSFLSRERQWIQAVDDVSFTIRKGETFGLVGESGSGKSTLGRMLLHLEKPTSGTVLFEDQDLGALSGSLLRQQRKNMQMIFQDPHGSVDPRWKVGDIIGEPFAVHGVQKGKERRESVESLLNLVGLDPSAYDRYPHEFSGGQRQRIGIARAIALGPKFLLADEAVSALDVSVQAQIINLLQQLRKQLDLTMLFIGHGLHVVRYVSDRIGVMYLGKLIEIAPSEQLFRHPAHPYTRALVASIPAPDPLRQRSFKAIEGEIPSPASPPSGCRFRTRCPAATARCAAEVPHFREVSQEHFVACHDPLL